MPTQEVSKSHRVSKLEQASVIVGFALVHFGAGYGAQLHAEGASDSDAQPMFDKVQAFVDFHKKLLESTLRNFRSIHFERLRTQQSLAKAAFTHGVLARKEAGGAGTGALPGKLTFEQMLTSFDNLPPDLCPDDGSGGGRVCNFKGVDDGHS
jgi:hypothetical protein